MSGPTVYGIYTAEFPYLDSGKFKKRPVIVVSKPVGKHNVVAIIPLSSKDKREPVDVIINDWKVSGLLRPSVTRVHRLTTILQADLLAEIGLLSEGDVLELRDAIRGFLGL